MKKLVSIFAVLFFCFSVSALSFSVFPIISYSNQSFVDKIYNGDYMNSMLEWNASYLFKAGVGADVQAENLIFSTVAKLNIPAKCGIQYDSDWRTEGIKTNYSTGNLYNQFGIDVYAQIKYKFELPFEFSVLPVISFKNDYVQLQAKDIYCWCGDSAHTGLWDDYSWDSEYAKYVKKYGIDLNTNILSFYFGAQIQKSFEHFYLGFSAQISPYTYIFSVDHHLGKTGGTYYQMEQIALFWAWIFDFSSGYFINKHNSLNLNVSANFCPETRGNLYNGYNKIGKYLLNETSSFAFSMFLIDFYWKYVL
ncbi:MAG: hypothetical protein K6A43_00455 [Treponema sp.]|nr:hypothetical protein [Treponema sp.]